MESATDLPNSLQKNTRHSDDKTEHRKKKKKTQHRDPFTESEVATQPDASEWRRIANSHTTRVLSVSVKNSWGSNRGPTDLSRAGRYETTTETGGALPSPTVDENRDLKQQRSEGAGEI